MKFEHFALNVPDSRAMGLWYVKHLGLSVVRSGDTPPHVRFLADETGRVMMEIYSNDSVAAPDYAAASPANFHAAFVARDARAAAARLAGAGAALFREETLPDGSFLVMMRDPWGIPLQLCQRTTPFP